jgi:phosphate transport system substrate-binding protein
MRKVTILFMMAAIGFCLSNGVMAANLKGHLLISGSDTLEPSIGAIAKDFMRANTGVTIVMRGGGTERGILETRRGVASIGMVSRALSARESSGLTRTTIAYDGICFVTSKKNPVRNLSKSQIESIYTGKIGNWKSVGGSELPITPLIHGRESSSNKIIAEFLGIGDLDLKGVVINDAKIGVNAIARDPKALFFVSIGEAFRLKSNGAQINILSISGIKADLKSVATNSYPLTRPLSLITKGDPGPLAKAFILYCRSKTAVSILRAHNFVIAE